MSERDDPLTDEVAEALLRRLSQHFGEPVQPLSRYCRALETWSQALSERGERALEARLPGLDSGDKAVREAAWDRYYALSRESRKTCAT